MIPPHPKASLRAAPNLTVFGFFSPRPEDFAEYCSKLKRSFDTLRKEYSERAGSEPTPWEYELLHSAGEFGLLLRIEVPDLRYFSEFESRIHYDNVTPLSWLFATELLPASAHDPAHLASSQEDPGVVDASLARLVVNLNISKSIFASDAVEGLNLLCARVRQLSSPLLTVQCSAVRHFTTLGATDLLVLVETNGSQEELLEFVLNLNALRTTSGSPITTASLTAVGFPCNADGITSAPPSWRPALLVRSAPGKFAEAYNSLVKAAGAGPNINPATLAALDGALDFACFPPLKEAHGDSSRSSGSSPDFFTRVRTILSDSASRILIHLLFVDPRPIIDRVLRRRKETRDLELDLERRVTGNSDEELARIDRLGQSARELCSQRYGDLYLIPGGLRRRLIEVLGLLKQLRLRSEDPLVDRVSIYAVLDGVIRSLRAYTQHFVRIHSPHPAKLSEAQPAPRPGPGVLRGANPYEAIDHCLSTLREWCYSTRQIVEERWAASIHEIFRGHDRILRPEGINKLLFISDGLINIFLTGVVGGSRLLHTSRIVTTHAPTPMVESIPELGLVTIPSRLKYSIYSAYHAMWHEVGSFIYEHHFIQGAEQEARLLRIANRIYRSLEDPAQDESHYSGESWSAPEDSNGGRALSESQEQTAREAFLTASDLFSDFVTAFFGFDRSFEDFALSLTAATVDVQHARRRTRKATFQELRLTARRLYFVRTVLDLIECSEALVGPECFDFSRDEPNRRSLIFNRAFRSTDVMMKVLLKPRFAEVIPPGWQLPATGSRDGRRVSLRKVSYYQKLLMLAVFRDLSNPPINSLLVELAEVCLEFFPEAGRTASREYPEVGLPHQNRGTQSLEDSLKDIRDGRIVELRRADLKTHHLVLYLDDLRRRINIERQQHVDLDIEWAVALENSTLMCLYETEPTL